MYKLGQVHFDFDKQIDEDHARYEGAELEQRDLSVLFLHNFWHDANQGYVEEATNGERQRDRVLMLAIGMLRR